MKKILYSSLLLSILQSILFWDKSLGISVILFTIPTILVILYNLKEKGKIKNKKEYYGQYQLFYLALHTLYLTMLFFKD